MTRKHFTEIARILADARSTMSDNAHVHLVEEFTALCATCNSNFQPSRFKAACTKAETTT